MGVYLYGLKAKTIHSDILGDIQTTQFVDKPYWNGLTRPGRLLLGRIEKRFSNSNNIPYYFVHGDPTEYKKEAKEKNKEFSFAIYANPDKITSYFDDHFLPSAQPVGRVFVQPNGKLRVEVL